jgi:hypothetical protein
MAAGSAVTRCLYYPKNGCPALTRVSVAYIIVISFSVSAIKSKEV